MDGAIIGYLEKAKYSDMSWAFVQSARLMYESQPTSSLVIGLLETTKAERHIAFRATPLRLVIKQVGQPIVTFGMCAVSEQSQLPFKAWCLCGRCSSCLEQVIEEPKLNA